MCAVLRAALPVRARIVLFDSDSVVLYSDVVWVARHPDAAPAARAWCMPVLCVWHVCTLFCVLSGRRGQPEARACI